MDFQLTEDHRLIEQSVREWAGREIAPRIKDLDREHRFDSAIYSQMADLGLLGGGGSLRPCAVSACSMASASAGLAR